MTKKEQWHREAQVFGKYLVNDFISEDLIERYIAAMEKLDLKEDSTTRYVDNCMKWTWMTPYYDAALAFRKPMPYLRRKLYTLLAILETSTDYTHLFLHQNRSPLYIIKMIFIGLRAIFRLFVGLFLLIL